MRAAQFAQRPATQSPLFKDQRPQIQAGTGRERAAVILAFGGRNVEILDFAHLLPAGAQLGDGRGNLCDHLAAVAHDVLQVLRGVGGEDFSPVHDEHAIASHFHFRKDVRRDQHGVVARQVFDQLSHGTDLVRVQPDRRFVQNDQLRFVHQRVGQANALAVTFGQVADNPAAHVRQPALLHHDLSTTAAAADAESFQSRAKLEVFAHAHVKVQRIVLRHVADAPPHCVGLGKNVVACDARRAAGRRQEAGKNAHRRALARAVRPEKTDNLAALD